MKKNQLDHAWRKFAEFVLPPGAPIGMRESMRSAFYAGAASLYGCLGQSAGMNMDETLALIGELRNELEAYREEMREESKKMREQP